MGASAAITLSYIGNGATAGGQAIADQTSGPKAKTLYAYGTLVSGSDATTAAVNFIDGTQGFGQTVRLSVQSVAAPVTLAGVANQAFYASVSGVNSLATGQSVTISGFATSANNVTATVNTLTSTGFYVTNSSAVAETNAAGTAVQTKSGIPAWVNVFYSAKSTDSSTAAGVFATGTNHFQASAVTATGFTLNYPTVTTSGVTIGFGAVIAFSN